MPQLNDKINTIADFSSGYENTSPNVRSIPNQQSIASSSSLEGKTNDSNNFNGSYKNTRLKKEATSSTIPSVYHIPTLQNDTYAKELLNRIVNEFLPILQRRQYNVISISELCCCNDGLDFQQEHDALCDSNNNNTTTTAKRKRRKIRKVSDNIWGYNRTTFGYRKQHTIHIRLRHTNDHTKFLLYEDVAGTLAHELSHCEYGPHDSKFFKLMDDILEEHANLMYNNHLTTTTSRMMTMTTSTALITPFSGTGQKLGSGIGQRSSDGGFPAANIKNENTTTGSAQGQVLGGDRTFVQWMSPKDAAVIAAETRRRQQLLRLRGDHDCCRPCYEEDDKDDDEDGIYSEEKKDDGVGAIENAAASNTVTKRNKVRSHKIEGNRNDDVKDNRTERKVGVIDIVDLTELNDDPYDNYTHATTHSRMCDDRPYELGMTDHKVAAVPSTTSTMVIATKSHRPVIAMAPSQWNCHCCTYLNRPLSLVCDMCSTTREILT